VPARAALRGARELLQLLLASRIAEDYFVAGPREDRAELTAHQAGTEDADSHAALLNF